MTAITWPHGHLPHAFCVFLRDATPAQDRWYTRIPRNRTYPLGTVQLAGLGPLGTDSHISSDQVRLQIDHWAEREDQAAALAAETFRLLDFRFPSGLRDVVWLTPDEGEAGRIYETRIERCERSGGGDTYLDEFARVWRATAFYNVKVNL